jgi:hypothetical protein
MTNKDKIRMDDLITLWRTYDKENEPEIMTPHNKSELLRLQAEALAERAADLAELQELIESAFKLGALERSDGWWDSMCSPTLEAIGDRFVNNGLWESRTAGRANRRMYRPLIDKHVQQQEHEAEIARLNLDLIYNIIDILLHENKFDECALILENLDVERYSIDILIGVLTATLPARSKIGGRSIFFHRVETELRKRNAYEPSILSGLE